MMVSLILMGAMGYAAVEWRREQREAHEWGVARTLGVETWERYATSGESGETRVVKDGTAYRISWGPSGDWEGIAVFVLSVEWEGTRGDRRFVWKGPEGRGWTGP
jgi:hypothetical protein